MDPITPLGPWGHMFLLHLLSYSQHMESSYQSESIFISLHVSNHWGVLETGSAWDLVKTYGFHCFLRFSIVVECLYNGFL